MNTIPVPPYEATYRLKHYNKPEEWHPCTVVGVHVADPFSGGYFIITVVDDDGATYAGTAEAIRPIE